MKLFFIILFLIVLTPLLPVFSQVDNIYPTGYNLDCYYSLSASELSFGDTLTITHILVNNESYALSGLYFSMSLPPELVVYNQSFTVNGNPVSVTTMTPFDNLILTGYRHHTWVVDSPEASEQISYTVAAGDSVCLTIQVIPSDIGEFLLPFHTAVFYGNNQPFFATGNAGNSVTVVISADVEDDPEPLQPEDYSLTVRAYPNPFNGSANIAYQGTGVANSKLQLEIYNTLGQLVYMTQVYSPANQGVIWWAAEAKLGSGIYLYKLANNHVQQSGKMLLIK